MTSRQKRVGSAFAAVCVLVALVISFAPSASSAESADLIFAREQLRNCQLQQALTNLTSAERTAANRCVSAQTKLINSLTAVSPSPSPSTSTSSPPSPSPSPSPSPTGSPSPTPSPSPTVGPTGRVCAPFPAMPDASCTGPRPGTVFKSCPNLLSPNTVYDSCLWQNTNVLGAKGAIVRNSKLVGGVMMLGYDSSLGMVITDTEIDGTGYNDPASYAAIGQAGYTCLRCNIHHTGMGARYDFNVTIRDSWLHDFRQLDPGAHMSGIGSNGGSNNVIEHNVIDCPQMACSGAMVAYGDFHPVSDLLAKNNLFNSPGSFCLYAGSAPGSGKPYPVATNMRYIDNLWGRKYDPGPQPGQSGPRCGQFGPVYPGSWTSGGSSVWTGNRWQDGSGTINP